MGEILGRVPRGGNGLNVLVWKGLKDGGEDVCQPVHLLDALPLSRCRLRHTTASSFQCPVVCARRFSGGAFGQGIPGAANRVRIGLDRHKLGN